MWKYVHAMATFLSKFAMPHIFEERQLDIYGPSATAHFPALAWDVLPIGSMYRIPAATFFPALFRLSIDITLRLIFIARLALLAQCLQ